MEVPSKPIQAVDRTYSTGQSSHRCNDELIVWPWMAVVANFPIELKNERFAGESGSKLKEEWVNQGFNPTKVHSLWNFRGHSSYAIVHFRNDWEGFNNAMAFEKAFEIDRHGKQDWYVASHRGDKMYAWIAREEDTSQVALLATIFRSRGTLRKLRRFKEKLKESIPPLSEATMRNLMKQKDKMTHSHNEEMKRVQENQSNQLRRIIKDHERTKAKLEDQWKKLKLKEEELNQRQVWNATEKRKMDDETMKFIQIKKQIIEQKKSDDKLLKLAEEHKQREKECLHTEFLDFEAKFDKKQLLQLEMECIKKKKKKLECIKKKKKKLECIRGGI